MATLRQVERFAVTLPTIQTSVPYTLATPLLDTSKAFLVFGTRNSANAPNQYHVSGEITNTTTLTFERDATGSTVEIVGYVAEFTAGVVVERGTVLSTTSTVPDAILSSITDLSKAFTLVSRHRQGTTFGDDDAYDAVIFDDAGTNKLRINQHRDNTGGTYRWQVVQYDQCTVKRGNASMTNLQPSVPVPIAPAVDLAKSFLIFYHRQDDGTPANIGQKLLRGRFTGATEVTFDRDNTGLAIDNIRWEVVEFTDDVTVEPVSSGFGATDGLNNEPIAPVSATDKAIALASDQLFLGKGNRTTDDVLGESMFTLDLTTVSNLQIQRSATVGSADVAAYVIDFGAGTPGPGLSAQNYYLGGNGMNRSNRGTGWVS